MLRRPTRRALAEWDAFRAEFAGENSGTTDYFDPLDSDEWARGLSLAIRTSNPRGIVYFTKQSIAGAFTTRWKNALPHDAMCITRSGVAPEHYAAVVRREANRCRCRVRFLGDLDPQDLAIHLSLAYGDHAMRPRSKSAVPIVHTGINDAWIAAAEKAWVSMEGSRSTSFIDFATIPMNVNERRYLHVVEQLGPPLEKWVGSRCAGLLRDGRKIEVEAILDLPVHSESYVRALRRLLER
jgi:hypothetical protein